MFNNQPDEFIDSNVLFLPDVKPMTDEEFEALQDEFKEMLAA